MIPRSHNCFRFRYRRAARGRNRLPLRAVCIRPYLLSTVGFTLFQNRRFREIFINAFTGAIRRSQARFLAWLKSRRLQPTWN